MNDEGYKKGSATEPDGSAIAPRQGQEPAGRFIGGGSVTFNWATGEKIAEEKPDRVYVRSYTEYVDIVVAEKDAREHMDPGDEELTDAHWEAAARYLSPEAFESCDLRRER